MAVIASPPVNWSDERWMSAKFDVNSQDATSQVHMTNIIAAVPTFFQIEVDETAAYPIAG